MFRELTAMRVPTPWIEAFNKRKEMEDRQKTGASEPSTASDPSKAQTPLSPKRMLDSYHSVVSTLVVGVL